jgi:hypothetical protein
MFRLEFSADITTYRFRLGRELNFPGNPLILT